MIIRVSRTVSVSISVFTSNACFQGVQELAPKQYWEELLAAVTFWMVRERATTTGTVSVLRQVRSFVAMQPACELGANCCLVHLPLLSGTS